jgi:hypothetical protein
MRTYLQNTIRDFSYKDEAPHRGIDKAESRAMDTEIEHMQANLALPTCFMEAETRSRVHSVKHNPDSPHPEASTSND